MSLSKLKAKIKGKKYLPFEQDGKTYNLYELPKGFVIKGDLSLPNKGLTELPDLSEVVVNGNFFCMSNNLISLKGAPQKVGGSFICYNNKLTSLDGAPKEVGRNFCCQYNQLTSLEGTLKVVGGCFKCTNNELTSLFGVPVLKEEEFIYCSRSLRSKYGFSASYGIPYEELCNSPLYRSEEAMNRVRSKQPQDQGQTKTQQQEKINAEFSQWLKDNATKSTRE